MKPVYDPKTQYISESGKVVNRPVSSQSFAEAVNKSVPTGNEIFSSTQAGVNPITGTSIASGSRKKPEAGQWIDGKFILGAEPVLKFGTDLTTSIKSSPSGSAPWDISNQAAQANVGNININEQRPNIFADPYKLAEMRSRGAANRAAILAARGIKSDTGPTPQENLTSVAGVTSMLENITSTFNEKTPAEMKILAGEISKTLEAQKKKAEEDAKKQAELAAKGISTTPGAGGGLMSPEELSKLGGGVSSTGQSDLEKLMATTPEGIPDAFKGQILAGGVTASDLVKGATDTFNAKESVREIQLRRQLSNLSVAGESDNILAATENRLGKLSLAQLEMLAATSGLEMSDANKAKLRAQGQPVLDNLRIAQDLKVAENDYTKNQLSRTYDRAITDREEFNAQQDAKLRRLAGAFGGGKYETLSTNIAVMHEQEKGQRILQDLKSEYSDKQYLISKQAKSDIDTYTNNVNIIENQMNSILEDKYASIINTVDTLLNSGVTNKTDLETAIASAKKDYMKTYFDVSEKAQKYLTDENQRLFDNRIKLANLSKIQQDQDGNWVIIDPLRNTIKQLDISSIPSFGGGAGTIPKSASTRDMTYAADITNSAPNNNLANNCVLYARASVPNLPYGLFSKEDKIKAVNLAGVPNVGDNMKEAQVGDVILTGEGNDGHLAKIIDIEGDTLVLEEANYRTGKITTGGTINRYDPVIYGFVSPSKGPQISQAIPGSNQTTFQLEGTNQSIEDIMQTLGVTQPAITQFTPAQVKQFESYNGTTIPAQYKTKNEKQQFLNNYNEWATQEQLSTSTIDSSSKSILAQTGLSIPAFSYLTQGSTALTRMNSSDRAKYMNEAADWANKNGIDISTFKSQYEAYNEALQNNIKRVNLVKIAEGELGGTLTNLINAADAASFKDLNIANVAKLWAGQQFNDPNVSRYAFHLNQLRSELALYNSAAAGKTSTDDSDYREAERIIKDGISSRSLQGFQEALTSSVEKMDIILGQNVDRTNKQVWDLFGVGQNFQGKMPVFMRAPDGSTGYVARENLDKALKANYTKIEGF